MQRRRTGSGRSWCNCPRRRPGRSRSIWLAAAITGCLTVASSAKCQSEAAELAHDKLMELAAEGQWQQGVLAGDFGPDIPLYQWKADVLEFESGTLRQLDVTVLWRQGGKDKSITLSTLVYTAQAGQTGGVLE